MRLLLISIAQRRSHSASLVFFATLVFRASDVAVHSSSFLVALVSANDKEFATARYRTLSASLRAR